MWTALKPSVRNPVIGQDEILPRSIGAATQRCEAGSCTCATNILEKPELILSMRALVPSKSVFVNVWSRTLSGCCDLRHRRPSLNSCSCSARGPYPTLQQAPVVRSHHLQAKAKSVACSAAVQHEMVPPWESLYGNEITDACATGDATALPMPSHIRCTEER